MRPLYERRQSRREDGNPLQDIMQLMALSKMFGPEAEQEQQMKQLQYEAAQQQMAMQAAQMEQAQQLNPLQRQHLQAQIAAEQAAAQQAVPDAQAKRDYIMSQTGMNQAALEQVRGFSKLRSWPQTCGIRRLSVNSILRWDRRFRLCQRINKRQ